ncbi:MAG: YggT family protein [Proteobacteria bacterium]|nr:YggT family protein [Pseudomonadota bacterium]
MFVIANLLFAIAKILNILLIVYMWIIIARAILSWVNIDPRNPIVTLLYQLTDPVLWRIRKHLPLRGVGIDLSPIIVILAIVFLRRFVVATLLDIANRL